MNHTRILNGWQYHFNIKGIKAMEMQKTRASKMLVQIFGLSIQLLWLN